MIDLPSSKEDRAKAIARILLGRLDTFPIAERLPLLDSLAALLPEPEATACHQLAYMLRKADETQMKFTLLLADAKAPDAL